MSVPFEQLYEQLRNPVARLCLGITRDRAAAEDATQETFLAVHQALKSFRGESSVSTWVYRIALRAALRQQLRLQRSQSEAEVPVDLLAFDGEGELAARDEYRKVSVAMGKLSTEHRVVLALFAVEGLGHREIAEFLDVKEGTVWSRLHAARKRLVELMAAPLAQPS